MRLIYSFERSRFELLVYNVTEANTAKASGLLLDTRRGCYHTKSGELASKFTQVADYNAHCWIRQHKSIVLQSKASALDGCKIVAPDGLSYLPFQIGGIVYALNRANCLIADEPGLGKTIEAIGVINASPWIKKVLVICPNLLKINWAGELLKWSYRKFSIDVIESRGKFPKSDVAIINYDILHKKKPELDSQLWDLIIADECQFVKDITAKRTKAVFGYKFGCHVKHNPIPARKRLFLTGTPIMNRPKDLWQLVRICDPNDLGYDWQYFGERYCKVWNAPWGLDANGANNLDELQGRLRGSFMIRRLKRDVLSELPPKRRQIVVIPVQGSLETLLNREKDFCIRNKIIIQKEIDRAEESLERVERLGDLEGYKKLAEKLHWPTGTEFDTIATLRRQVAEAKLPYAIEYLKMKLEEHPKIVVGAHHVNVINNLRSAFENKVGVVSITGSTSEFDRQQAITRFQNDPTCRIIILGITIAVGITLTAASYGLAIELDWRPSVMQQWEDRMHRVGQTDQVLIQHLVFDRSTDSIQVKTIISKQEIIDQALGG